MDRRGRRSKRSARYRDLGKAPAIRRPPLPRARPFAPAPAIPIQPVPTQPERRQPVRYQFGNIDVFVGSKAAKEFPPDFLKRLVEAWQKKLRQPPITMFISIDGEKSPALNRALDKMAGKLVNDAHLRALKDNMLYSSYRPWRAITALDKEGGPVACAVNIDVTETTKKRIRAHLKIPQNIPVENIPDLGITANGFHMWSLVHEIGHCGTAFARKERTVEKRPPLEREFVADRFSMDFFEDNPDFSPNISRKTLRQMRAVETLHDEIAYNRAGEPAHRTHLTSFALERGRYSDIQEFNYAKGFQAMHQGLYAAVENIINRVAASAPLELRPGINWDDVILAVQMDKINPEEFNKYREKRNWVNSTGGRLLATHEERKAVEGYKNTVEAWREGHTEPDDINDSARDLLEQMKERFAPKVALFKLRRGLYNDPKAFARKVNELHQNEEFGRGNQTAELAGLYVEGIKRFLPDWLEDKNELEAGNKPAEQHKTGQDQRAGTMPIR